MAQKHRLPGEGSPQVQETVVLSLSLAYLGLLFAVAYVGDRHARAWSSSRLGPIVYGLSLAIYCTSWTFYGAVGRAATSGPDFILIYVGPLIVVLAGYPMLRKIITIAKRHNVTSIADFLGSRYGKSRAVAVSATLIASVGALPYIALQLQAVSSSFIAIAGPGHSGVSMLPAPIADTSFIVAALMAIFTILFGVRHVQAAEQHRGMMLAIAFESVVKLVALLAVGPFVIFGLFDGPSDLMARVAAAPEVETRLEGSASSLAWVTTTLLAAAAFLCLPRQFHVAVVEHDHPGSLKTARWLFPAYLVLINLFVVPIAAGGLLLLPRVANPDLYVLSLPLSNDEAWLSLLVFIGGLSAATSMVIVACMALSGMIGNELVMPLLLRRRAAAQGDLGPLVLLVRRAAVLVIVLAGYAYHKTIAGYLPLASIGMISFCAVANFMPGLILGLYWRRANRFGVVAGLAGGFAVWLYGLLIPSLQQARGKPLATPLAPFLPEPLAALDPIGQGFLVGITANTLLLIVGSLLVAPRRRDQEQADAFVLGAEAPQRTLAGDAASRIGELRDLVARFLGAERAERAFADRGLTLPAALALAERLLSGTIGAASARVIMAAVERRRLISPRAARAMLDEASEAIRYSSEILRNALDHAGLGIAAFDRESRLEIWNERFPALLGLDPDAVTVGADAGALAEVLKRPETSQVLERRGPNASVIEIRLDPMPGGGFVATCHDVTARVRAAEALRDSERRIRVYTDNVPVLIAYIDRDERYRFTNRQYQAALNLTPEEAEGRTIVEVIGEERYHRLKPHIDGVLSGEHQTFEIEFPTNDANIEVAQGTYIPHFDASGAVAGFFLLYQDVTQARAAEAVLRQSKETLELRVAERTFELERSRAEAEAANLGKTRFIAAASHDLLQPLHAARLFTAALADRQPGNDLVTKIDQGLGAVESLLDALLDISKLDAGALKPERRSFAIQPLLDSLAAAFAPFASKSGARLTVLPCSASIATDPALLRRILQNFVSNALRYGGSENRTPRVVLGCRRAGKALRFEVWDNGPGIPEDKRDLVFQEFVRLHPAAVDRGEGRGLGLGLAIVERIARMLGHPVSLRSVPGRGSVFSVTVPLAATAAVVPAAQPAMAPMTGLDTGAFVLCIDDEAQVRDAMATLLGGWGCRIIASPGLDSALASLAEEGRAPDLLVVDYHLGSGPDGLAVIERLRQEWGAEIAAALITADRDPSLRRRARGQRVDLLHKPVKPAALRALLRGRGRSQPVALRA
ncbi:MAG: PAS domain S-box protein [Alphaproteobacteria bacterium]|nr:PAS domain S-box protein [Alphaproteobacteria bacterium]